jgi:hypothetical protein
LVELIPEDQSSPYLAQLYHYSADHPIAVTAASYSFAAGATTRAGVNFTQLAPISSGGQGQNWLVVANTGLAATDVNLEFIDNSGAIDQTMNIALGARSQQHININAILPSGQSGVARIKPQGDGRVIAKSMVYFLDGGGKVTAAYGAPARPLFGGSQFSGYNTFMAQFNWLKLFNTTGSAAEAGIEVYSLSGNLLGSAVVSLPGGGGYDLELRSLGLELPSDHYGLISVRPQVSGSVFAELLRVKPWRQSPGIDLAKSLPLR